LTIGNKNPGRFAGVALYPIGRTSQLLRAGDLAAWNINSYDGHGNLTVAQRRLPETES
jgi:hypothetical protein